MQKRWFGVGALAAALCLVSTMVLAQTIRTSAGGSRTAKCQADCKPGSKHGRYRAYNTADPNLVSPEGRKMYAECVRICLAPLPSFFVEKPFIEGGGSWFGMTKKDCLTCHARGETKGRSTGVITLPSALKRDP